MSERTNPVPPVPVRAWAEYEEWSVFILLGRNMGYQRWQIPKGADEKPHAIDRVDGYLSDALELVNCGPLRSIRVLLSTGHEVHIHPHGQAQPYWVDRTKPRPNGDYWCCSIWGEAPTGWEQRPHMKSLETFFAATDSEAVERALAAAIAWVTAAPDREGA